MPASVTELKDAAPAHLSSEARDWWRKITREFAIDDDAGRLLLTTALEAYDLMKSCQAEIDQDGLTVRGSTKQKRAHPLLTTQRDARAQMLMALKSLNLDLEPLRDKPGRPGGM